jgi:Ca2+-binding EF-hand superfamily protein
MFLLAWSHDAVGLDIPERARFWYEQIISRYPDSPGAEFAQSAISGNDDEHKARERESVLLARYDRNNDGLLDYAEKQAMQRDPTYQREEKSRREAELAKQLGEIMTKFDLNGDGKLDVNELTRLHSEVVMYAEAPPGMLAGRKIVVLPFLTKDFPPVSVLMKKYDLNHDGGLNAGELKAFARDLKP